MQVITCRIHIFLSSQVANICWRRAWKSSFGVTLAQTPGFRYSTKNYNYSLLLKPSCINYLIFFSLIIYECFICLLKRQFFYSTFAQCSLLWWQVSLIHYYAWLRYSAEGHTPWCLWLASSAQYGGGIKANYERRQPFPSLHSLVSLHSVLQVVMCTTNNLR